METSKWAFWAIIVSLVLTAGPATTQAQADDELKDFLVYGVMSSLNMGNPGEVSYKDYHINMGTKHGAKTGTKLRVLRKLASYDLQSKKLFKDIMIPVAQLNIIYADESTAIARLDNFYPESKTPVLSPRAVIIGDLVEVTK